jgi:hypothetical protein
VQPVPKRTMGVSVRGFEQQEALEEWLHQLQAAKAKVYRREAILCILLTTGRWLQIRRLLLSLSESVNVFQLQREPTPASARRILRTSGACSVTTSVVAIAGDYL